MEFGNRLKKLRTEHHLTQLELSEILGTSKSNISKYEAGSVEPNLETLVKISKYFSISIDYLIGDNSINDILNYDGTDEKAVSFSQKLANQIDFNNTKINDLSAAINVPEKTIVNWLRETDDSYLNYFEQLSDFFKVQQRYWVSPGAISPGIEPNIEEYLLILFYRSYNETGKFNDLYGTLEHYFPGITLANNTSEKKLLTSFQQLEEDYQDIIIGNVKKYLLEQKNNTKSHTETLPKASGK